MLGQNYFTRKTIGWGTMALFHCHDVKEPPASAVILAVDELPLLAMNGPSVAQN
jgi:hypothetical protein